MLAYDRQPIGCVYQSGTGGPSNADGPDSPETFSGDTIDVGALAEEFFELAIDPYPRKPGVSLEVTGDAAESDETSNPLREKLARLRQKS